MKKILLEAPILTQSGYGEHARLVFSSLKKVDNIQVMINPLNWGKTSWKKPDESILNGIRDLQEYINECRTSESPPTFDIQVHVGIPNEFEKKAPLSICVTAGIESDRVDPAWILQTHRGIDKLIVPSEHSKSTFTNANYAFQEHAHDNRIRELSCNSVVEVIPYPVKFPNGKDLQIDFSTEFNFLTIAMMGPRKNIKATIDGFVSKFKNNENVGLVIKTNFSKGTVIDRDITLNSIKNLISKHSDRKCKIHLLHGNLSESELHSLYTHPKIKAYVSTTHGEGYGLPIFEAAYSGLPVIATDWSGHLDFLTIKDNKGKDKKMFAPIKFEKKKIQQEAVWENILFSESKWAFIDKRSYEKNLEDVYNNYKKYKKMSSKLKSSILKTHKLKNILDSYISSIFGQKEEVNGKTIEHLRKEALQIKNVKKRASFAKQVLLGDLSQTGKLEFLKDLFKGEKACLLSCGPTLTEHNSNKVKSFLKDKVCLAIKQSFELYKEDVDIHFYNCANFKEYDYSEHNPIIFEASTTPYRLGPCDLKFFIQERNFENSIAAKLNFDEWTLDEEQLLRPYGPGIEYEVVFYTMQHLGFSEVTTIGWDNKLTEGEANQQHFYNKEGSEFKNEDFIDHNEVAKNQESVKTLKKEVDMCNKAMLQFYRWIKDKGTNIKIVSRLNESPNEIERVEI